MAEPSSLHELLSDAIERAAQAHEDSHALAERRVALSAALDDTLRCVREDRRARRKFGNGQPRAGRRSRPG